VAERESTPLPKLGSYLFLGNSGTGKTTVARVMGRLLHELGVLSSDVVVERKATELSGRFVGAAQDLTGQAMAEARGGILFIDEAYGLMKDQFGGEVQQTLLGLMTDPQHQGKTVVILAGYDEEMRQMMAANQGTANRFTERWHFADWPPAVCADFVLEELAAQGYALPEPRAAVQAALVAGFGALVQRDSWGNARDAGQVVANAQLARADRVYAEPEAQRSASLADVEAGLKMLLDTRPERRVAPRLPAGGGAVRLDVAAATQQAQAQVQAQHSEVEAAAAAGADECCGEAHPSADELAAQAAAQDAAFLASAEGQAAARDVEAAAEAVRQRAAELAAEAAALEAAMAAAAAEAERVRIEEERLRREEEARIAAAAAVERARLEAEAEARRQAAEVRRKELEEQARRRAAEAERVRKQQEAQRVEREVQQKLRRIGRCEAGYEWIKIPGGYRCWAGGHTVSDAQIEAYMY